MYYLSTLKPEKIGFLIISVQSHYVLERSNTHLPYNNFEEEFGKLFADTWHK